MADSDDEPMSNLINAPTPVAGPTKAELDALAYKKKLKEIKRYQKEQAKLKASGGDGGKSSSSSSGTKRPREGGSSGGAKKQQVMKDQNKAERLGQGMKSFLWWDAPELDGGKHWDKMEVSVVQQQRRTA